MSPFNEARYRALLEGLKIEEERLSEVDRLSNGRRFDPGFYLSKKVLLDIVEFGFEVLSQEAEWITQGPNPDFIADEGMSSLTGRNIARGFVSQEGADQVSEAEFAKLSRFRIKKGDLFVTLKGAGSTGKVAILSSPFAGIFSRNVGLVRLKQGSKISPEFLFAFLASKPGQELIDRGVTGGTGQLTLPTSYLSSLPIPLPSLKFRTGVSSLVSSSHTCLEKSQSLQHQAQRQLLIHLDLLEWSPPDSKTYVKRASEVIDASRFDAEFFHPRIDDLFDHLGNRRQTIADVARLRKQRFGGTRSAFNYLEIGAVSGDGLVGDSIIDGDEAPSRATWRVHAGDVVTSTVRPIRGLTAMIEEHQENAVASSGFAVLEPRKVSPELLLCYLKLPVICELMDLHTSASMYPAISVPDILNLPFKHPGEEAEREIVELVREAREKRRHSKSLLERAKRAVEIAIEEDEETAMAYLDGKHYVADELLPKLFGPGRHYVDLETIQRTIEAEAIHYEPETVRRYLHQWEGEGRIHGAGRGWFSDLPVPFEPAEGIASIDAVERLLAEDFPFLEHTIWSTKELTAWFHHLPTRHATFLRIDRDAFEPVADALRQAGHRVVVHPLGEMAKKFTLEGEDTVILRPRLASEQDGRRSSIEHTLVDLLHETRKLGILEGAEYREVVRNLATSRRLQIPALKRYAARRKIEPADILDAFL